MTIMIVAGRLGGGGGAGYICVEQSSLAAKLFSMVFWTSEWCVHEYGCVPDPITVCTISYLLPFGYIKNSMLDGIK